MTNPLFLAADWGTTNLRAWVIGEDGSVLAERRFPWGVGRLQRGEAEARLADTIRPELNARDLPALLCGMIGSTLGMIEVAYVECPAGLHEVAAHLTPVPGQGPQVRIAPGLRCRRLDGDPDVMRGEETKILGWVALDAARRHGRHLLLMPGTHNKWVLIEDGAVRRFVTAMSGELFELVTHHGVLKSEESSPDEPDAFAAGVDRGAEPGALAAKLFSARSRVVGGDMARSAARSYISGLLIGDEVSTLPALLGAQGGREIGLLGDEALCGYYAAALGQLGMKASRHDGDAAVISGLKALYDAGGGRR
jgi:2-dehydro-3-deoxygalactonokinase